MNTHELRNETRQTHTINVVNRRGRAVGSITLGPVGSEQGTCAVTEDVAYSREVEKFVTREWVSRHELGEPEADEKPKKVASKRSKRKPKTKAVASAITKNKDETAKDADDTKQDADGADSTDSQE